MNNKKYNYLTIQIDDWFKLIKRNIKRGEYKRNIPLNEKTVMIMLLLKRRELQLLRKGGILKTTHQDGNTFFYTLASVKNVLNRRSKNDFTCESGKINFE